MLMTDVIMIRAKVCLFTSSEPQFIMKLRKYTCALP